MDFVHLGVFLHNLILKHRDEDTLVVDLLLNATVLQDHFVYVLFQIVDGAIGFLRIEGIVMYHFTMKHGLFASDAAYARTLHALRLVGRTVPHLSHTKLYL